MLLKIDTRPKLDRPSSQADRAGPAGKKWQGDVNAAATRMFLFLMFSLPPADFSGFEGHCRKCAVVTFSWLGASSDGGKKGGERFG